jgi:2-methylfumaryl-CoA isomerase
MTSNPAPPRTAENAACAIASLASGGFARDFATAGGERVMVAARNQRQFTDLAKATGLAGAFAFAERLLRADFSDCGDLYTHRDTIAALLAAWFAQRTTADLAAAFGGTSVPWAPLHEV